MIKLVASDIDGTLIPEGTHEFPKELGEIIDRLKELGVMFVAASGRQYNSMHRLFHEKAESVIFVSGNGSYVKCRNYHMKEERISLDILVKLVFMLRSMEKDGYCYVAETKDMAYVETKSEKFKDLLVKGYHYEITEVDDILKECDGILKISLYHESKILEAAEKLIPQWNDRLRVIKSGTNWVDFMNPGVDKGSAIACIQQIMGISREETLVFGDNHNDVGMFSQAKYSYAVENASKEVQEKAKYIAKSPEQKGVLQILKELVEKMSEE